MSKILVLDCTLRDGGYVNNWDFGKENIISIADKLAQSGIEIVECGFISQSKETDADKSIYKTIQEAESYLPENKSIKFAAMMNYGEYNVDDLPQYNGGALEIIRLAFHKKDIEDAVELCKKIQAKGYKVFVQPMVTLNYTQEELLWLINEVNKFTPDALYIVDSFGTVKKTELLQMYDVMEKNLDCSVAIGFHSHNNMQLSFSNAQELMNIDSSHNIIIDSSVYGMGRGAGNLCSELITKYINDNYNGGYDLIPILELVDEQLTPIFLQSPWGYSIPFYIASINHCHPNYASYLLERQTLSVKDIHKILGNMSSDKKIGYDKNYIKSLYESYQSHQVDDSNVIADLKKICENKKVLVIAPGKSIENEKEKIVEFCKKNSPVVISVNFVNDEIKSDYVFAGNMKRYKRIADKAEKIIATSNITTEGSDRIMVVNYTELLNENEFITDNSGMMVLNLLRIIGCNDVFLAGFDGFSVNVMDNYYREKLISGSSKNELLNISNAIKEKIQTMKKSFNINFVTSSIYNKQ